MGDKIWQIVLMAATAFVGWLMGKLQTKRERKQSDIKLIENAISPLLKSIQDVTDHSTSLTDKLLKEQTKSLQLMEENNALLAERVDLVNKIEKLEKKVSSLATMVKKLSNEKDNSATAD